jgi:ubiquinone/menaquinone biosynthesis C-methylase UbiE
MVLKMKGKDVKTEVKNRYSQIVTQSMPSCCGPSITTDSQSEKLGYSKEELGSVPDGADLGLGCGNPVALASLKEGDVVLDLGSGAGFDAFLSANAVGKSGKVIGVDMTPQMIARAKENAVRGGYDNVEFRLGEIEDLPVDENSVDVIISNCVINLSPDKQQVFNEAYRVLRPGGRLMVSDIVITKPLPEEVQQSVAAWTGCIAGASLKEDYLGMIKNAGFENVEIQGATKAGSLFDGIDIDSQTGSCCAPTDSSAINLGQDAVESIKVSATK